MQVNLLNKALGNKSVNSKWTSSYLYMNTWHILEFGDRLLLMIDPTNRNCYLLLVS